jgi:hypothetical protein
MALLHLLKHGHGNEYLRNRCAQHERIIVHRPSGPGLVENGKTVTLHPHVLAVLDHNRLQARQPTAPHGQLNECILFGFG